MPLVLVFIVGIIALVFVLIQLAGVIIDPQGEVVIVNQRYTTREIG